MTRIASISDALERVTKSLAGGGESRPGQVRMAEAVALAVQTERHLAVAAGTGTGKSLAYLVPTVLSGHKVVIATATKALQDQLAAKDVPSVQTGLRSFSFAVLKGRSNYVCRQRLAESAELGVQGEFGDQNSTRAVSAKRIVEWATRTETGDRAELEDELEPAVWVSFSVSADECPGAHRCPSGATCFAELARARAQSADVIAVNHHLLGADLAASGAVLPEHDVLVIDEAHALEDTVTDSLAIAISPGRIRAVAAMARASGGRGSRGLETAVDSTMDAATRLEISLENQPHARVVEPIDAELSRAVELVRTRLEALDAGLGPRDATTTDSIDTQPALRAMLAGARLREDLSRFLALKDGDVAWVDASRRPTIRVAPIDVASLLKSQLFATRTVVLTSATITPGLGARLGANPEMIDELDVGSPFDYETHGLLYCAAHLPDRRSEKAEAAIHDELAALIGAAGGRTLALFTSYGAMRRAAEEVRGRVAHPILVQGDLAKAALVERFSNEHAACLFATMGFWQGIDVPGATLSLVVIDRIPFPRPDDPLIAARRERAGKAAFFAIDMPRAASLLAQGAGRLVRSTTDRGVVAVLDPRLAVASYRWQLVRALPPMRRTKVRAEAEAFLRSLRDDAVA